ncbi:MULTISPECIES: FecR domain-containing protein [unclassified Duganella]|uniref:FecR family protein n=1 Tax=unclassified Duganella TaxID=2636909 RepID=UPI000E34F7C7|nr:MULTISPECIES: FecR family protein [unclassified Duganella]RFP11900.1 hypothetical protein D0T23_18185 [Duganella sp. BJB475]RFP31466.1 hypothetical protein D0T21_16505 [Duganella sp. BJB476]
MRKLLFLTGALLLAHAAHAAEAGKVIFVAGAAKIAAVAATLDAPVGEGELLSTGADGYIYIKTIDNGLFILRPNTQARIASYHIDADNPANTRIKLELLSGVARSQSGQAVKLARQNFRFNTPVAAIGVRGTDFTVFTDSNTSRVTVLSGGITMSGFAGGCRPEGTGPCEGTAARELSAAQRGQLLQLQRGQAAPQLLQGNSSLVPDVVAPPRGDEPGKIGSVSAPAAPNEPSLDPRKNVTLEAEKASQQAATQAQTVKPTTPDAGASKPPLLITVPDAPKVTEPTPPVVVVVPPVVVPPVVEVPPVVVVVPVEPTTPPLPPKEISWGRFTAIADSPATSSLSKAGTERLGMTEDFVLFRSRSGSTFATPVQGSVAFSLASSEGYIRNLDGSEKAAVTLQNGQLSMNFDKASFSTQLEALTQTSDVYKLATTGKITKDGIFSSLSNNSKTNNMSVTGALNDLNSAAYIFQGSPDAKHVINGATTWKK